MSRTAADGLWIKLKQPGTVHYTVLFKALTHGGYKGADCNRLCIWIKAASKK